MTNATPQQRWGQGKTPRVASQNARPPTMCSVHFARSDLSATKAAQSQVKHTPHTEFPTCHCGPGSHGRCCSSGSTSSTHQSHKPHIGHGQEGRDTPARARVQPARCQESRLTKTWPYCGLCRPGLLISFAAVSRRPRSLQPHGSQKGKYCSQEGGGGEKETQTATRSVRFL